MRSAEIKAFLDERKAFAEAATEEAREEAVRMEMAAKSRAEARREHPPLFPSQVLSLVLESVHTGRFFER